MFQRQEFLSLCVRCVYIPLYPFGLNVLSCCVAMRQLLNEPCDMFSVPPKRRVPDVTALKIFAKLGNVSLVIGHKSRQVAKVDIAGEDCGLCVGIVVLLLLFPPSLLFPFANTLHLFLGTLQHTFFSPNLWHQETFQLGQPFGPSSLCCVVLWHHPACSHCPSELVFHVL